MKKFLLILLLLSLCFASAVAQTREAAILLEGEEERIEETLYQSGIGIYFWYDAEMMEVDESMSESGSSLIIVPTETREPISLEIMKTEAINMLPWKFLEMNAAPGTEYTVENTENGDSIHWFTKLSETNKNIEKRYYAVDGKGDSLVAILTCPADVEGWNARFHRLIQTIGFGEAHPKALKALWAEEAQLTEGMYDSFIAYEGENAASVVFYAEHPLSGIRFMHLEHDINENGEMHFDEKVVYTQNTLTPERPLLVQLVFYGDMPNNGISFVDAQGIVHSCALSVSGEDGSLQLIVYK